MQNITGRRARSLLVVGPAVAAAVGLSACGSFDSKASGEHLLKDWVPGKLAKAIGHPLELTSVDCPSGIKQKTGTSYDCKVSILDKKTGKTHKGTVTIHIVKDQVRIFNGNDLHVS
jgi:hypothetical protein